MLKSFVILIIAILAEIIIAGVCIRTNSYQKKLRSIVRICEALLFTAAIVSSVIKGGFQWYPFGMFIFVWAVICAISFIRGKSMGKEFKYWEMIGKAVLNSVLIFIFLIPAFLFIDYNIISTTGGYPVGQATYTYIDENRVEGYTDTGENRKLTVTFWYPKNANQAYPLIIFSHGGMGIRNSNESLYHELASHGYVICSLDHTYQCLFAKDTGGKIALIDGGYMREILEEDATKNPEKSYLYYAKWMKLRMDDISFVIDYIKEKVGNNSSDSVYQLVDPSKIGLMGYSMGGSAALGVGRERGDISAVIALESPFLYDITGVESGRFVWNEEKYPVPVLNVYSDSSWTHLNQWAQYAENERLLNNPQDNTFYVYIKDVGHFTLTDLALCSPIITRILNGQKSTMDAKDCLKTINEIALEFFDCYLKN
jgi:dienelactone hydrolase